MRPNLLSAESVTKRAGLSPDGKYKNKRKDNAGTAFCIQCLRPSDTGASEDCKYLQGAVKDMEKNLWEVYTEDQLKELESLTGDYKKFLDTGKTERECVTEVIRQAEAAGYIELSKANEVKRGDKVYAAWMGKSIALFNIGEEPVENGMNILGAHIDSPRMDLKQNPLYEDSGFAYFDTHYYGGIKKYQWVRFRWQSME